MSLEKDSSRFHVSRWVLVTDKLMNFLISSGGIALVLLVFGIFGFIFSQILPLFLEAEVKEINTKQLPEENYTLMVTDEWGEKPLLITKNGSAFLANSPEKEIYHFESPESITWDANTQTLAVSRNGFAETFSVIYNPVFKNNKREIELKISPLNRYPLFSENETRDDFTFEKTTFSNGPDKKLFAAIIDTGDKKEIWAVSFSKKSNLLGEEKISRELNINLTDQIDAAPVFVQTNSRADVILVATTSGTVFYFQNSGANITKIQNFNPFKKEKTISSMDFLSGGASVVFTDTDGQNLIYSLFMAQNGNTRLFGKTKTLPDLKKGATQFVESLANKAYLVSAGSELSLRYATTETIRFEKEFENEIKLIALTKKYQKILLLDSKNTLHIYSLNDPHPEAGWKAFFGKLWYEGANKPAYTWQSSGGSDDFEPKFSLIPLIIGTLKGTFYALFFAIPIALLAGIYTSEFLQPGIRSVLKPVMELMSSLPSVILGFLAALWLAPLVYDCVPSILLVIIALPIVALTTGFIWSRFPTRFRAWLKPGYEGFLLLPILILTMWVAWKTGFIAERLLFSGDFQAWWPKATGLPFEQRNSLIVGFVMGFAVIPIIFTITDDSLSSVPKSLRSASLACGASRWQTTSRVILPAAASGIFSAIMIGFGRAVGETMIVLMATGNTSVMDFNIFSGMRTLSANLAVELPEAPHAGTLYRTLFLGAAVLFLMTFFVNTMAEMMRQYLRNKYRSY